MRYPKTIRDKYARLIRLGKKAEYAVPTTGQEGFVVKEPQAMQNGDRLRAGYLSGVEDDPTAKIDRRHFYGGGPDLD